MQETNLPLDESEQNTGASGTDRESPSAAESTAAEPEPSGESAESSSPPRIIKPPARLHADTGGVLPIIPRDIDEAQRYTNGLIAANQVPTAFRVDPKNERSDPNGPLILMGVLKSMEVGLPPQTGLEVLLPMRGRFTLWGDGPIALALASGKVKDYVEATAGPGFDYSTTELKEWPTDFGFQVSIWRVGQEHPYIGRFTVGDAKRAGLWMDPRRQPWVKSPLRMLKIRARAFAVRDGFADALMGLGIMEEIEDALPPEIDGGELKVSAKKAALLDDE